VLKAKRANSNEMDETRENITCLKENVQLHGANQMT
jgi:hypothetical protein